MQRVVRVFQKIAPGSDDARALPQRLHNPALFAHHADQLLGVGRQAVALHADRVEGRVEAECFAGEAGARDGSGGVGQTVAMVESEAGLRQRRAFGDQPQRDLGLDPKRAAIGKEQPDHVGPVGPRETCADGHQRAVGQRDLERQAAFGGGAVARAAPEDAVLAHPSADRRLEAGQRAPHRRSQPARGEFGMQRRPGAAGFDGDRHRALVHLQHAVHRGEVEQHRAIGLGRVAAGIAHPSTARDDRMAGAGGGRDRCGKLVLVERADNGGGRAAAREDVVRVEVERLRIRRDFGAGRSQRFRQRGLGQRRHQAAPAAARTGAGSASGKSSG